MRYDSETMNTNLPSENSPDATPLDESRGESERDLESSESPADATASPDPAEPTFVPDDTVHSLDPRHVLVTRVKEFLGAGLVIGPAGIGLLVLIAFLDLPAPRPALLLLAWVVVSVILLVRAYFWPAKVHDRYRYLVNETRIQIRRGVFWREVVDIPRSRVQHTDIKEGPIERQFELSSLVIHTAGTTSASVTIEGLTLERSTELRNLLVETRVDDAV